LGESIQAPVRNITPTTLQPDVIEQLRQADHIVTEELMKAGEYERVSQVPVILVPLPFGKTGGRSIVIRTIITNDFMTGVPAIPGKDLAESTLQRMDERILAEVEGISRVMFDLTGKPPGTTEWE